MARKEVGPVPGVPTVHISGHVAKSVFAAIEAAVKKHGPLTTDPVRSCSILGREWAEAMDEALLSTRPNQYPEAVAAYRRNMYEELAQVAGTAMLIMQQVEEDKLR